MAESNFKGVAVIGPYVYVWGRSGVRFNGEEQFQQSCMFRRHIVALTTSKIAGNVRSVEQWARDDSLIR